jgi:hypothetical protein
VPLHLERLRAFLRRLWNASDADQPYGESNAVQFAAELTGTLDEAESEWEKIDTEILKRVVVDAALSLGPAVVSGGASWVPTGIIAAITGSATLAIAHRDRRGFPKKFPGAFLMNIRRRSAS